MALTKSENDFKCFSNEFEKGVHQIKEKEKKLESSPFSLFGPSVAAGPLPPRFLSLAPGPRLTSPACPCLPPRRPAQAAAQRAPPLPSQAQRHQAGPSARKTICKGLDASAKIAKIIIMLARALDPGSRQPEANSLTTELLWLSR